MDQAEGGEYDLSETDYANEAGGRNEPLGAGSKSSGVDPAICPICGKDNRCGNLKGMPKGTCWCFGTKFPEEIFKLIPEDRRGLACICQACVEAYREKQVR